MFVKLTGITFSTKKVASAPTRIDVAVAGDGQVSFNNTVMKAGAKKVRRMKEGKVVA